MGLNKSQKVSWMPMIVIAAAAFVSALDATFMNVSMSQVVADLNTNVATIQKMVTFYTLITASLLLVSAKLQDIVGKRKLFLLGMIIYAIGDLTAAVSPNATVLFIGWSLLEGIGSALMSPAMISIVTETYSGTQRTRALAIVSTIAGVAVAVGPLFGGVVTTMLSWRYGFLFRADYYRLCAGVLPEDYRFPRDSQTERPGYHGMRSVCRGTVALYAGSASAVR